MNETIKRVAFGAIGPVATCFVFWCGGWDFERGASGCICCIVSIFTFFLIGGEAYDEIFKGK